MATMQLLRTALVLAAGCRQPAETSVDRQAFGHDLGTQITLTDIASLPTSWTAAAGWRLRSVRILGDIDTDGYTDAAVAVVRADLTESNLLVVHGPLRTSKVLPGDEAATIPNASVSSIGDGTGDGVLDLDLAMSENGDLVLVPGPFAGMVDVEQIGIPHLSGTIDFNGDGILDHYTMDSQYGILSSVHLFWGPSDQWMAGPPDVTVAPVCDGTSHWEWLWDRPRAWPDITGDGTQEMWIAGYGDFNPCSNFLFPVPATGVIDPASDPLAHTGVEPFTVVADQSGDGMVDVYDADTRLVLGAPIDVGDDGVLTSDTFVVHVDPLVSSVYPQWFDVTGDGISDFVALDMDLRDFEFVNLQGAPVDVVLGSAMAIMAGGSDLSSPVYERGWDLRDGTLASYGTGFVEDGVAVVLVEWDGRMVVVDLGDGTAVITP